MSQANNITPGHLNPFIKSFGAAARSALLGNIYSYDLVDSYALAKGLKVGYRYDYGDIYAISFNMPKHGIMVHHGAGSGWKNGIRTGVNSEGPGRLPREWFSEVMDIKLPPFADQLAKLKGDMATKTIADATGITNRGTNTYRINL